jgi:elongation factor P
MIKAMEMKKGMIVRIDGKPCQVLDYQHVKLGKGGAVLQTKFKDLIDGGIVDKRIRSEETLEPVFMDKHKFEYLYSNGSEHVFMNKEDYDQLSLNDDIFADGPLYCKPNTDVEIHFLDGSPLAVILPNTVELKITDTPPALKGATATNQYKKATMETGLVVSVPPFVDSGELIRIDTRSGEYIERVKK